MVFIIIIFLILSSFSSKFNDSIFLSFCLLVGTDISSNACLTEVISSFMNAETLGLIKPFGNICCFYSIKDK